MSPSLSFCGPLKRDSASDGASVYSFTGLVVDSLDPEFFATHYRVAGTDQLHREFFPPFLPPPFSPFLVVSICTTTAFVMNAP